MDIPTQTRSRKRRRNQDADVIEAIEEMANVEQLSAAKIHVRLEQVFGDRAPKSVRTTQSIVADLRGKDDSEPWALLDAEPATVRLVLDVLAAVVGHTEGRRAHLTRKEVDLIVAVDAAAHDLDPWDKYRLARAYLLRRTRNAATSDLDLMLAFKWWRGPTELAAYLAALSAGHVPQPPAYLFTGNVEGYITDMERLLQRKVDAATTAEGKAAAQAVADALAQAIQGEPARKEERRTPGGAQPSTADTSGSEDAPPSEVPPSGSKTVRVQVRRVSRVAASEGDSSTTQQSVQRTARRRPRREEPTEGEGS